MAAPQVSAAAALLLAMRPTLTPAEVEALLYATALPLAAPADRVGVGLVNVEAAVRTLLPSDLTLSPRSVFAVGSIGSAPLTVTIALANPSLEPIMVTGTLVGAGNWFSATNFTGATFVTSIRRDQPAYVTLAFSPTALVTGTYTGELQLDARRTDQSRLAKTVPIALRIGDWNQVLFLPLVNPGSSAGPSVQPFTWETGANEQIYVLGESGLVEIGLPFPFPASGPLCDSTRDLRTGCDCGRRLSVVPRSVCPLVATVKPKRLSAAPGSTPANHLGLVGRPRCWRAGR